MANGRMANGRTKMKMEMEIGAKKEERGTERGEPGSMFASK